MKPPNHTAHVIYVILTIIALPAFIVAAGITTLVGLDLPHRVGPFDFGPAIAILGVMALFALYGIMSGLWVLIYAKTKRLVAGLRNWTILSAFTLAVHVVVFDGFVRRNLDVTTPVTERKSYGEAIAFMLSQPDGAMAYLLFWPVLPLVVFAAFWLVGRSASLSMPS